MAERTLFPEWIAQQAGTRYPFGSGASMTNGTATVPEGVFVDAALYPVGGGASLHLSKVELGFRDAVATIGTPADKALATAEFSLLSPPDVLTFADAYGRPAGVLVTSGRLGELVAWGVGTHEFDETQTGFAATCVFPMPAVGVRGVLLPDGSFLSGEVWLVGGDGVVFRKDGGTIRVDVSGDPLFRRKLCTGGEFAPPRFVRSIKFTAANGETVALPDDRGGISLSASNDLAADTVLRVDFADGGLLISAVGSPTNV